MAGEEDRTVPVWARERGRRSTLTREAIVETALEMADAEGIEAVSIRRVAAALGARTMTLYTYIDSKDDLLDLMADRAAGELIVEGELPDDWREAVTLLARREREASLRHPWVVDMVRHRSHAVVGPNVLRHMDQSMAAVAGLNLDAREALRVIAAIDDYMLGYVTRESREREITRRTGLSAAEHLSTIRPYLQKLVEAGEFVNIQPLLRGDVSTDDMEFEQGLRWLLDGIERQYSR